MSTARKTPVNNLNELHAGMDEEDEELRANDRSGKRRVSFRERNEDVKRNGDLSEDEKYDDEEEGRDKHVKTVKNAD
jgi:hypothetical protein